jgi:hypothetical protein
MQDLKQIRSFSDGQWLYLEGASPECTSCSSIQVSMPSEACQKEPMAGLCQRLFEHYSIKPYAISAIGPLWKSSGGRWSRSRAKLNSAIPDGTSDWYISVYSDQWIDDWIYEKNLFRFSIEQRRGSINIQITTPMDVGINVIDVLDILVIPNHREKVAAFSVDLPFELSPEGYLGGGVVLVFPRSFGEHTRAVVNEITNARDWQSKHAYWRDGIRDIYPFMLLSKNQRKLPLSNGQSLEALIQSDPRLGSLATCEGTVSWSPTYFARDILRKDYRPSWLGSRDTSVV